jgi:hypothetical protein
MSTQCKNRIIRSDITAVNISFICTGLKDEDISSTVFTLNSWISSKLFSLEMKKDEFVTSRKSAVIRRVKLEALFS